MYFCSSRTCSLTNGAFSSRASNKSASKKYICRTAAFVQDNHSRSVQGVLCGLHYQLPPHAQGKLVRVTKGEVFDVAVDIRKQSPTFGQWVAETLSAENKHQLWLPEGFAHGFYVINEVAELQYKCTDYYAPECKQCIRWDSPRLAIEWSLVGRGEPFVSYKDRRGATFGEAVIFQ